MHIHRSCLPFSIVSNGQEGDDRIPSPKGSISLIRNDVAKSVAPAFLIKTLNIIHFPQKQGVACFQMDRAIVQEGTKGKWVFMRKCEVSLASAAVCKENGGQLGQSAEPWKESQLLCSCFLYKNSASTSREGTGLNKNHLEHKPTDLQWDLYF